MNVAEMSAARLAELVTRFPQCRIAVIGDYFLDKYLDVDAALAEVSIETGLPAHQVVGIRCFPGAAGTIVNNLAALGARRLHAIGFTGDDGEAFALRKALEQLGCVQEHLHASSERHTPTYLKPRDVASDALSGEHSRYDTKNRRQTPAELESQLIASLERVVPEVDAVIVLDQVEERDCGVVTEKVRSAIMTVAERHPHTHFWADSRRRIREFSGVMIKANQFEAVGKSDPAPDDTVEEQDLMEAVRDLRSTNRAPVIVTRGAAGMLTSDPEWTVVPAVPVTGQIDPTGAGDSATAGAVMALCSGATLPEAALIGNLVASITIQQVGTTGVARPEQLAAALETWSPWHG